MTTSAETTTTISEWQHQTFGRGTPAAIVSRANEEMAELLTKVALGRPYSEIVEEAADVIIVLCGLAPSLGFNPAALWAYVEQKMTVNRARKWDIDADGRGKHRKHKEPAE